MGLAEKSERHAKWKALVEEKIQSGLSQVEFCRQRNLVLSQFSYYHNLFNPKNKLDVAPAFAAVTVQKNTASLSPGIRIALPNGIHCVVPMGTDVNYVKQYCTICSLERTSAGIFVQ